MILLLLRGPTGLLYSLCKLQLTRGLEAQKVHVLLLTCFGLKVLPIRILLRLNIIYGSFQKTGARDMDLKY